MNARTLIDKSLRSIGAIRLGQQPTFSMFDNALVTLNLMLDSWSADELMPYDIYQYEAGLFGGTPNYTINSGEGFAPDSVCSIQQPDQGGTQNLTINGTKASDGVATLDIPRHVIITSTGDDSGRTFVITGTTTYGDTITETITGPDSATVSGVKQFKTVTSVTIDGNATGLIMVGMGNIINIRRPLMIIDAFTRDATGVDTVAFPVTRERYDEIADKDLAGTPELFYYDRPNPSGEIYVYPVPSSGSSIVVTVGVVEHIANGDFASGDTGWTLESQWAVVGGKLVRTPGDVLGPNLVTNGTFTGNADGWTLGSNVFYNTNQINVFNNAAGRTLTFTGGIVVDVGDWVRVGYTLKDNIPNGEADFPGSEPYPYSRVRSLLDNNYGAEHRAKGAFTTDLQSDGNGNLSIVIDGGGGSDYIKVGVDDVTAKLVNGGDGTFGGEGGTGADTASQITGDLATEFVEGSTYWLTFTVSGYVAGSCIPSIAGTDGDAVTEDGDYSMDIVAGSGTSFILSADTDFAAAFANISIVEITSVISTVAGGISLFMDLWLPFAPINKTDLDNEINLPGQYILALKWNLAVELSPEYGVNVSQFIFNRAQEYIQIIKWINTRLPKPTVLNMPVPQLNGQTSINRN